MCLQWVFWRDKDGGAVVARRLRIIAVRPKVRGGTGVLSGDWRRFIVSKGADEQSSCKDARAAMPGRFALREMVGRQRPSVFYIRESKLTHPPSDPRSPVQPGGGLPVKPLLLALVAAASLWAWQQSRNGYIRPEPTLERPTEAVPEGLGPPEPSRPEAVPPPVRARANLVSLFSSDDYPARAIRNEEQGTVQFRVTIAPDGLVSDCTVIASSGSPSLDRASCAIVSERARFEPARDANGQRVGDSLTTRVRWELPEQ